MGKKKNKNKKKKVNPRKERYAKFRKEKPSTMNFAVPASTPEQERQKKEDDRNISLFLRNTIKHPTKEVNDRKTRSKR